MSELGGWVTAHSKNCSKIDSVGKIIETVQMKVIEPSTGAILGANQIGELCFKHKNCMLGYYGNPYETKKMFDDEGQLLNIFHTVKEGKKIYNMSRY